MTEAEHPVHEKLISIRDGEVRRRLEIRAHCSIEHLKGAGRAGRKDV
ncbi:MAG: hypothetical protein Q8O09_00420 [Bacillota bacterium]|nr:hypothetical protein [Bacillota bacterium]